MAMEIVHADPPNIDSIKAVFDLTGKTPIFCYGNKIYNPSKGEIDLPLLAHEAMHSVQQDQNGGPELWWHNYLTDIEFRKKQEVEAYQEQYAVFCRMHKDRNVKARFLNDIARDFASPMYGNIINVSDAIKTIRA